MAQHYTNHTTCIWTNHGTQTLELLRQLMGTNGRAIATLAWHVTEHSLSLLLLTFPPHPLPEVWTPLWSGLLAGCSINSLNMYLLVYWIQSKTERESKVWTLTKRMEQLPIQSSGVSHVNYVYRKTCITPPEWLNLPWSIAIWHGTVLVSYHVGRRRSWAFAEWCLCDVPAKLELKAITDLIGKVGVC